MMIEADNAEMQDQNFAAMPSIGDVYNMNRGQLMVFLLGNTKISMDDEANFWTASTANLHKKAMSVITLQLLNG